MLKIMVKIRVKTDKSKWVLKMVYYTPYDWIVTSNVCCWMETVNILDIIRNCLEKVFVGDKLKNRVINIRWFLGELEKKV